MGTRAKVPGHQRLQECGLSDVILADKEIKARTKLDLPRVGEAAKVLNSEASQVHAAIPSQSRTGRS